MTESFQGGCACGYVKYRMTTPPMFVHCCHCRCCQRETGASFAVNALVEADRVELLQGKVEKIDTPSDSGQGQQIARCPKCRVAIWSHYAFAGIGDLVCFLRVGTLDEPDAFVPDVHIYTASKQPWVQIPAGAVTLPEYYKASDLWPAESLARRKALHSRRV